MPRRKNKRKAIQNAKSAAQPKPKRVASIGHVSTGHTGFAMAFLASGMLYQMRRMDRETETAIFDDLDSLYINDKEDEE